MQLSAMDAVGNTNYLFPPHQPIANGQVKLPSISSIGNYTMIKCSPTSSDHDAQAANFQSYLNSPVISCGQAIDSFITIPHKNEMDISFTTLDNICESRLTIPSDELTESIDGCQPAKLMKLESNVVSPGGSSVSSADRVSKTRKEDESFDYCEECQNFRDNLDAFSNHLIGCHANPRKFPSHRYYGQNNLSEALKKKPYTTLYPSKKRKPESDRVPRPQNQYMIFSNYVREPLMHFFHDVNHAQISQTISQMWKKLSPEEKLPFKEESKRCEELHKLEYPDYRYQPKQKRTAKKSDGTAAASKPDLSPQEISDASPAEYTRYFDTGVNANLLSMSSVDRGALVGEAYSGLINLDRSEPTFSQCPFTGLSVTDDKADDIFMGEYSDGTVTDNTMDMKTTTPVDIKVDTGFSQEQLLIAARPATRPSNMNNVAYLSSDYNPCMMTASGQSSMDGLLQSSASCVPNAHHVLPLDMPLSSSVPNNVGSSAQEFKNLPFNSLPINRDVNSVPIPNPSGDDEGRENRLFDDVNMELFDQNLLNNDF